MCIVRRYESAEKVYSAQVYRGLKMCGEWVGLGDVFADLVEEVAEGGGIA